jgi:sugar phosphate permease
LLLLLTGFLLNLGYSSFAVFGMGMTTPRTYPLALALVNAAGQAGGAAAPLATGMLLDAFDWNAVFVLLAACSALALGVLALVREPRPG